MIDDFEVEEKFDPLKEVKPKEEPSDTIVTPCHSSNTENCINEEPLNESSQPLNLSDEHDFSLNSEIKIETFDDFLTQEEVINDSSQPLTLSDEHKCLNS